MPVTWVLLVAGEKKMPPTIDGRKRRKKLSLRMRRGRLDCGASSCSSVVIFSGNEVFRQNALFNHSSYETWKSDPLSSKWQLIPRVLRVDFQSESSCSKWWWKEEARYVRCRFIRLKDIIILFWPKPFSQVCQQKTLTITKNSIKFLSNFLIDLLNHSRQTSRTLDYTFFYSQKILVHNQTT